MLAAGRALTASRPDLVPVLALAPGIGAQDLVEMGLGRLERAGAPSGPTRLVSRSGSAIVVAGRTRAVQCSSTACAVASGTATLETALFGTPLAIVYRVGWLNYAIARRVVRLDQIGLPNIVAREIVAPELIQGDLTAERLAATLAPWLDDPARRDAARDRLHVVRERLGEAGAAARAAAVLEEILP
jgi:lipid-A-disaccharide synthase